MTEFQLLESKYKFYLNLNGIEIKGIKEFLFRDSYKNDGICEVDIIIDDLNEVETKLKEERLSNELQQKMKEIRKSLDWSMCFYPSEILKSYIEWYKEKEEERIERENFIKNYCSYWNYNDEFSWLNLNQVKEVANYLLNCYNQNQNNEKKNEIAKAYQKTAELLKEDQNEQVNKQVEETEINMCEYTLGDVFIYQDNLDNINDAEVIIICPNYTSKDFTVNYNESNGYINVIIDSRICENCGEPKGYEFNFELNPCYKIKEKSWNVRNGMFILEVLYDTDSNVKLNENL